MQIVVGDFLSDIDMGEYLTIADNMCVCDFNTVANIEPVILAIYNCEIGTDVKLVEINGKKKFIDNNTRKDFIVGEE